MPPPFKHEKVLTTDDGEGVICVCGAEAETEDELEERPCSTNEADDEED